MAPPRLSTIVLAGSLLAAGSSCDRPQHHDVAPGGAGGVTAIEPGSPELVGDDGQTIYVPAYSAVATANNSQLYQLAITLGIRNTDQRHPIVITSVRYHHQDGRLLRDFVEKPLRLSPLAATEFLIREGDTSGGTAASFLIEWVGGRGVGEPVVEAVMVGTAGNQGISFTCPGRVVAGRGRDPSNDREAPPARPGTPAQE